MNDRQRFTCGVKVFMVSFLTLISIVSEFGCQRITTDAKLLIRGVDVGEIAGVLASGNPDDRRRATLLLGKTGLIRGRDMRRKVVELLGVVLEKDPEPLVRSAAALSLSRILEEEARPLLLAAMEDESPIVRADCARLLCRLAAEKESGNEEALDALLMHLKDDGSLDVRVTIARQLKAFKHDDLVAYELMQCLKTDYQQLKFAAADSLMSISKKKFSLDYDYWLDWYVNERIKASEAKGSKEKKKGFFSRLLPWNW